MKDRKFVKFELDGIREVVINRHKESKMFNSDVNRRITLGTAHGEMINFATFGVELLAGKFDGIDGKLNKFDNIFFESKMLKTDKENTFVAKFSLSERNKQLYTQYKTFGIIGLWDSQRGVLAGNLIGNLNLIKEEYFSKSNDVKMNIRSSKSMDVNLSKLINRGFLVFSVNYTKEELYDLLRNNCDSSLNEDFSSNHVIPIQYFNKDYFYIS